jgi:hypothetical protein
MTTIVMFNDFNGIKESFTEEEMKEKYGKLIVISKEEYFKYTHPIRERKVKKMR